MNTARRCFYWAFIFYHHGDAQLEMDDAVFIATHAV